MSVSKWAYHPGVCDATFCPGDCDFCGKADEAMEANAIWEDEDEEEQLRSRT